MPSGTKGRPVAYEGDRQETGAGPLTMDDGEELAPSEPWARFID
jgi:hypothetical protein